MVGDPRDSSSDRVSASASTTRVTVILVKYPSGTMTGLFAALVDRGLDPVVVPGLDQLSPASVARAVVAAPMGAGSSELVESIVRRFPYAVAVAVVERLSVWVLRSALRLGTCGVIAIDEPCEQAAETIVQASLGFTRFPSRLIAGWQPEVRAFSSEEVRWLELLEDTDLTVDDIARRVGWSRSAMYRRLGPLYRSLGAATRQDAVLRARRLGLLS